MPITTVPVTLAAVEVPRLAKLIVAISVKPPVPPGRLSVVLTSASGTITTAAVALGIVNVFDGVVLVAVATLVVVTLALPALLKLTTIVSVAVPPEARLAAVACTVLVPTTLALNPPLPTALM